MNRIFAITMMVIFLAACSEKPDGWDEKKASIEASVKQANAAADHANQVAAEAKAAAAEAKAAAAEASARP